MSEFAQQINRDRVRKWRKSLSEEWVRIQSQKICYWLEELLSSMRFPPVVGAFQAISKRNEPSLHTLFVSPHLQSHSIQWAFPRVLNPEQGAMDLAFCNPNTRSQWIENSFGILEPTMNCLRAEPEQVKIVFVPGLVFSETGSRIGYGTGYYDRYLKDQLSMYKVGVCFEEQLFRYKNPHQLLPWKERGWDIGMNCIVTEQGIYPIKNEGK